MKGIYMNNLNVVIIGSLHHNTLGVLRSFGEAKLPPSNIHLILVGSRIHNFNFISQSKYIKKENISYVFTSDDIIPLLKKIATDNVKRCIICCSDYSAEVVISNYDILSKNYSLPTSDLNIKDLMIKEIQCQIAKNSGLSVPHSLVISKTDTFFEWNCFPCITKPLKSCYGAGKSDIHIVKDYNSLNSVIRKIDSEKIQLQEFIVKKFEYQLIGCSLNKGNLIIIPGFTRIIRQPPNTNTGYLVYESLDKLNTNMKNIEQFIKSIGYEGLFSMEFLRDNSDKDYFLEINLRNDGNAYCVKSAGVNLPYIYVYYKQFNRLPNVPLTINKSVYFMPELSDLKRGIREVGLYKWILQFLQAESHAIFNKNDIRPFLVKIISHFIY